MLDTILKVRSLLTASERRQARYLMIATLTMGLMEIFGITSIIPFISVVVNPDIIKDNHYLSLAYQLTGAKSENNFILYLGIFSLVAILLNNSFSALTTYLLYRFIFMRGHVLSERLLKGYLRQPYEFFLNRNTTELTKNILTEVRRVVNGILMPGIRFFARGVIILFIVGMLLVVDIKLALTVSAVLGGIYILIFWLFKDKLLLMGGRSSVAAQGRFKTASEALEGVKELKILGRENVFSARFTRPSKEFANAEATGVLISGLPRYGLETLAFLGVILIILYLVADKKNPTDIIPLLSLYVFSGYRMMPALQQMFSCATEIRYNLPSLDILCNDLSGAQGDTSSSAAESPAASPLRVKNRIALKNISYRYPGSSRQVFSGLNLMIRANTTVGLVGATGCGKTTIIDLILGLLTPSEGEIEIDDDILTPQNMRRWQQNIGYVPQDIYISDDTVERNIAFGIDDREIDREAVMRAARMVNLHDFVMNELREQYDSRIGEKGINLSGGQRQRIGLARALYHDPSVLVLDEATSALDSITEHSVLEELQRLTHKKTIIMIAHRLATVRNCDEIFVLSAGKLACTGSYENLVESCEEFRKMVQISASDHNTTLEGQKIV